MGNWFERVMAIFVLVVVVSILSLGGWAIWKTTRPGVEAKKVPTGALVRVVDCEARVVCFRYMGFDGVSCVPLSQTPLSCPEEE